MKNILKDFLFFNQRDKSAIILLLILIGITGLYSIYINSLSKIDPSHFIIQDQIEKEFKTYEENLDNKEIISVYNDEVDITVKSTSHKEKRTQSKPKSTKLTKGEVVDLNNANFDALLRIPGIGKTLALRIIEYRTQIGGAFETVEQLKEIKGITNSKLTQIIPFLILNNKTIMEETE